MKTKTKVQVTINRKEPESFTGVVLNETDTHYYVQHGVNPELGGWYAKQSAMVNCRVVGE